MAWLNLRPKPVLLHMRVLEGHMQLAIYVAKLGAWW